MPALLFRFGVLHWLNVGRRLSEIALHRIAPHLVCRSFGAAGVGYASLYVNQPGAFCTKTPFQCAQDDSSSSKRGQEADAMPFPNGDAASVRGRPRQGSRSRVPPAFRGVLGSPPGSFTRRTWIAAIRSIRISSEAVVAASRHLPRSEARVQGHASVSPGAVSTRRGRRELRP